MNKAILVSACLAGTKCRYDATDKWSPEVLDILRNNEVVLVCPEVLAGLGVPRSACVLVGGDGKDVLEGRAKVVGRDGKDYTKEYIKGAQKALKIALERGTSIAYLRKKSPSCDSGDGVFACLLKKHGVKVISL
jgi:uncharacterized protein YbbK (DUF523 family)